MRTVGAEPRINPPAPTSARQALAAFRTKVRTVHRGGFGVIRANYIRLAAGPDTIILFDGHGVE